MMLVSNLGQFLCFHRLPVHWFAVDLLAPIAGRTGNGRAICLDDQALAVRARIGHGLFVAYEIALWVAGAAVEWASPASSLALHDLATATGIGAFGAGFFQYRPGVLAVRKTGAG